MERLKELRRQAGFTQAQLAQMLRTTQQTVGRWESGKVEPDIATLRDLAMIYGTSVDDILGQNPLTGAKTITSNHVFFRGDEEGGEIHKKRPRLGGPGSDAYIRTKGGRCVCKGGRLY